MKIFNEACLRFGQHNWARDPELALLDTLLEQHPEFVEMVTPDVIGGTRPSEFGRKDTPTVEQIMRAALYKELKGLDYRQLEYAQVDSRICVLFIKLDERKPYSFQVFQKYISRIREQTLNQLLVAINRIAIAEGLEDLTQLRTDSTVVKSNIHYPTNNALIWDCIKTSQRLLERLQEQTEALSIRDYRTSAKRNYFKINNTRSSDKRVQLFRNQLITFTKCINQVDQVIRNPKKKSYSIIALSIEIALKQLLPMMRQVYYVAFRKEIMGEKVPQKEKIFSIYEPHTDIIVKGSRQVEFGHKVSLATGKSNLILDCRILKGNPSDANSLADTLKNVSDNYERLPRDLTGDGGYASKANVKMAREKGVQNIVFNKIVGSIKNIVSSKNMETRLKRWRSGIEANISNFKRKFEIFVCMWKGMEHFKSKVLWSAIAYNVRVMTRLILQRLDTA